MYNLFTFRHMWKRKFISNSMVSFHQIIHSHNLSISRVVMAENRHTRGGGHPTKPKSEGKCLFKFGVITDVQYGDVDDRLNFEGSSMRYYRTALKLLEEAVNFWRKSKPDFVLQLGDIIEGNHVKREDRETTLKAVLDVCKQLDCYVCHLWGNHEFYRFSRGELACSPLNSKIELVCDKTIDGFINKCNNEEDLCSVNSKIFNSHEKDTVSINKVLHHYERSKDGGRKYYFTFSPHPNFKIIALDSYDISICGRENTDWEYEEARKILSVKNTNENWNSPYGLTEPHFVKFNGGISADQLAWLNDELTVSSNKSQHVIIISHVPIHPESTIFVCNIWNYQDLLDIIWRHPCVRACLCGHSHEAGDFVDHKGIQHVVFPAVLECRPNENAFANVFVYEDKINIIGHGKVKSYVIGF